MSSISFTSTDNVEKEKEKDKEMEQVYELADLPSSSSFENLSKSELEYLQDITNLNIYIDNKEIEIDIHNTYDNTINNKKIINKKKIFVASSVLTILISGVISYFLNYN
jgi:hypothetical protein